MVSVKHSFASRALRIAAFSAAVLLPITACKHATVYKSDGSEVEGSIAGGTGDSVVLTDEDGEEVKVARDEITSISHPGLAEMITGGTLTAVGLGLLIPGALALQDVQDEPDYGACDPSLPGCADDDDDEVLAVSLLIPGIILSIAGAATLVSGGVIYGMSEAKADEVTFDDEEEAASLSVVPSAMSDGENVHPGAVITLTW